MTIPLRLVLPLLVVFALLGWSVGGLTAERRAAIEWTYNAVTFEAKGDKGGGP